MQEVNAINYLLRALPPPPKALTELILRWQLAEYASQGFTTIGVLGMVGRAEDPLGMLRALSADPSVPVRSVVYALPEDIGLGDAPSSSPDDRFIVRGVKLWVDGSPYTGGAALAEPYANTALTREVMRLEPGHMGPLNYELGELTEVVRRFHEAGYHLAFHTHGERAIQLVLDAAESVLEAKPWGDHRHRLEHHATIHSDNPMTPVRALRVMRNAVLRTPRKGDQPLGAPERLTVQQALEAMTINAAWQLGVETRRGSLEPGKAADLVRLSRNPLETPAEELDEIKVLGTWIDGQPVDTRTASLPNLKIGARALFDR